MSLLSVQNHDLSTYHNIPKSGVNVFVCKKVVLLHRLASLTIKIAKNKQKKTIEWHNLTLIFAMHICRPTLASSPHGASAQPGAASADYDRVAQPYDNIAKKFHGKSF